MRDLLSGQEKSPIQQIENSFRLFYNHTLFPELQRMERLRLRLLTLLVASAFFGLCVLFAALYVNVLAFTFALLVPIGFYMLYLLYRVQRFRHTFKPRIVNLLMDFIDDLPNVSQLNYHAKKSISKDAFTKSGIFVNDAPIQFSGEDYIHGKIGELNFEMSELEVRELSKVRSRYNYVFSGMFMHAVTQFPTEGRVLVIPKEFHKYLTRSIRAFTAHCGQRIDSMLDPLFEEHFITYANKDALYTEPLTGAKQVRYFFPDSLQNSLAKYRINAGKEIYAAFQGQDIYFAIAEPRNMLEPNILFSNVDFHLVRQFMEDILIVLLLINRLDETH